MLVQQRIFHTPNDRAFVFTVSDSSKDFLLEEGTDLKYGARHLKRAIERLLVQPMANLIATDQVRGGDWIRVDYNDSARALRFAREAEGLPVQDMARLVDTSVTVPAAAFINGGVAEPRRRKPRRSRSADPTDPLPQPKRPKSHFSVDPLDVEQINCAERPRPEDGPMRSRNSASQSM